MLTEWQKTQPYLDWNAFYKNKNSVYAPRRPEKATVAQCQEALTLWSRLDGYMMIRHCEDGEPIDTYDYWCMHVAIHKLNKSVIRKPMVVYRAVRKGRLYPTELQALPIDKLIGKVFISRAILSCTLEYDVTNKFGWSRDGDSRVVWKEILVPKGTRGLVLEGWLKRYFFSSEREVAFPPGTQIRITSAEKKNDTLYLTGKLFNK